MKHPFWIVNLGLLFLVLLSIAFVYFTRVKIPARESIEPVTVAPRKDKKVTINIKKIYENDLFGTYVKELPRPKKLDIAIPFPEPPQPQKITIPQAPQPEFLDPLDITLKGIIVVGTRDTKNRAIIQDNKTKRESTYKVGDKIQDAQLIRIFRNKIILLRTNGQQEVLYLREQDAQLDPVYMLMDAWDSVVKKTEENNYLVSPKTFVERVTNLAQFIEMINLTTAYEKGTSIGVRVGQLAKPSLGNALGLQDNDIITHINGIQTRSTQERLAIYNNITKLQTGDTITIQLTRKGQTVTITYTLEDFISEQQQNVKTEEEKTSFLPHRDSIYDKKYAFTPTINKMKRSDRSIMHQKGKSPSVKRSS